MNQASDPLPPWLDQALLQELPIEASAWGYFAAGEEPRPVAVSHPDEIVAVLREDEGAQVQVAWSPASERLALVYEIPELAGVILARDRHRLERAVAGSTGPSLGSLALLAGLTLLMIYEIGEPAIILLLGLFVLLPMLERGPLARFGSMRDLGRLADAPDEYRADIAARLRYQLWLGRRGKPWSLSLVALIIGFALAQTVLDTRLVFAAGALLKPATQTGEWWRCATMALLHGGALHIFFNAMAMYALAPMVEALLGGGRMLLVFWGGAIAGALMSCLLLPEGVSVGASGGILAFGGCMLSLAWIRPELRRLRIDGDFLRWAILLTVIGFLGSGLIDNPAHLGGWLGGMLLGCFFSPASADGYPGPAARALLALGLAVTLLVSAWLVWRLLLLGV